MALRRYSTNRHFMQTLIPSIAIRKLAASPSQHMISCSATTSANEAQQSATGSNDRIRKEDIVIVGAGIAGLATAVALRIRARAGCVAEDWRHVACTLQERLDAIGVGSEFRPQFLGLQGLDIRSSDGRRLRSFNFKDEDQSQEVRSVERKVLLEAPANKLPRDSIRFSSGLKKISQSRENDETMTFLELDDGSLLHAKHAKFRILVARLLLHVMGPDRQLQSGWDSESQDMPGNAFFEASRFTLTDSVSSRYGKGVRVGYLPISSSKVYWYICYNNPSPGPKVTDVSRLRQEASNLIKGWPNEIISILNSTPDETIIKTPLADRWLWPGIAPRASRGNVVLVGDAWHPMTPNLGQGACCALEDSLVLVRKLTHAIKHETVSLEDAFGAYDRERWPRIFRLTVRVSLLGSFLQLENGLVCSVRDNVVVPKLLKLGRMLEHTNFSFEPLV